MPWRTLIKEALHYVVRIYGHTPAGKAVFSIKSLFQRDKAPALHTNVTVGLPCLTREGCSHPSVVARILLNAGFNTLP